MSATKPIRVSEELVERFRAAIMYTLDSRVRDEPGFQEFVQGIPARDLIRDALELAAERVLATEDTIFGLGKIGIPRIDNWVAAHERERQRLWEEFSQLATSSDDADRQRAGRIRQRLLELGPIPVSRGGGTPPGSSRRPGRG